MEGNLMDPPPPYSVAPQEFGTVATPQEAMWNANEDARHFGQETTYDDGERRPHRREHGRHETYPDDDRGHIDNHRIGQARHANYPYINNNPGFGDNINAAIQQTRNPIELEGNRDTQDADEDTTGRQSDARENLRSEERTKTFCIEISIEWVNRHHV